MYEFLIDNGMTREEYHFFLEHNLKAHCIMGNDYYVTNEHRVRDDGLTGPAGEVFRIRRDHAHLRESLLPARHAHGDQPERGAERR